MKRRIRRQSFRPVVECLEDRLVLSTFAVNSSDDFSDGVCDESHCSLREAIEAANGNPGEDRVTFNIPGEGVPTIPPSSQLPIITEPVIIDGTTQPAGKVEIDGSGAGETSDALHISGGGSTVRGLVINRFLYVGLHIVTGGGNRIEGCYIGTDVTGTTPLGNAEGGIRIENSADNIIGGTTAAARNVISGNRGVGIVVVGPLATGNVIQGNFIGTDVTGTGPLSNAMHGILFFGRAHQNLVGGAGDAGRNIIANNSGSGVAIAGVGSDQNVVAGNLIGTDMTGSVALGNGQFGVAIFDGARSSRIGTDGDGVTDSAEGNLISGNSLAGVGILNSGTDQNVVAGNFIGTDATGTTRLGNVQRGVDIYAGAQSNRVGTNGDGVADVEERNLISANGWEGVSINGAGSNQNVVAGNFIGTDVTGTAALGNSQAGLVIFGGSQLNLVGTNGDGIADAAERNLVSGNGGSGMAILDAASERNTVAGNFIGTDKNGSEALGNLQSGVVLYGGASRNLVGGTTSAARNVISGNKEFGIAFFDQASTGNRIEGNYIGTDANGTTDLGNGRDGILFQDTPDNMIGGSIAGAGNIISGNDGVGIWLVGQSTTGNTVQGNFIGTDKNGTAAVGNRGGIVLQEARGNIIGDKIATARNLVSGNAGRGIELNTGSTDNLIQGNFIGSDRTGTVALGNSGDGVSIIDSPANTIGGLSHDAGNLISSNGRLGVWILGSLATGNRVQGNFIGTDVTGTARLGNRRSGVEIQSASNNRIGGSVLGAGNVISGNGFSGVEINGSDSTGNIIRGNFIGTDVTGTARLGNFDGVYITDHSGEVIGGTGPGEGNVISGNTRFGVAITGTFATQNIVQGNFIGTNAAGTAAVGNSAGVFIESSDNQVGGTTPSARNVISGNSSVGVQITGPNVTGNVVQGNFIGTDVTGTADLGNGFGVLLLGAANSLIGGSAPGARNIISGNERTGVDVQGDDATGNVAQGNLIGTDATGTQALGNLEGVFIQSAPSNTIGGSTNGSGNIISGNKSFGVRISGLYATGNVVQGNSIGISLTGTALGNGGYGVLLGGPNNTIGGTTAGQGNTIAFNGRAGVFVDGGVQGNGILSNSISSNAGLGIDLWSEGLTPNDPSDVDVGANQKQNFPVLNAVNTTSAGTRIQGMLNSTPATRFRLEFFSTTDPLGFGEGQTYLGSAEVMTDEVGNVEFTITFPTSVAGWSFITATATDPENNTSEFSAPLVALAGDTIPSNRSLAEAKVSRGVLIIQGDAGDNNLHIESRGPNSYLIIPLGGTLINGRFGPLLFERVSRGLHIRLGDGTNTLHLDGAARRISLRGTLIVLGGRGSDTIWLDNVSVSGRTRIATAEGNDVVRVTN
ncbi:MAG: right-handed parallel beta-helix repeat-containing protein, partial [Planctomycetes bacterium]|nr:right-handed parallel beta-helix repeat-containing protein [Planctomycetota bacterium]